MTALTLRKKLNQKKLMSDSNLHPLIKSAEKALPKGTIIGSRVNPLIANMPSHLKDFKNFEKIQRAILDAGATKHSHAEIGDWAKCLTCKSKNEDRVLMMRKLGFTSGAQYRNWLRIHTKIKTLMPLI